MRIFTRAKGPICYEVMLYRGSGSGLRLAEQLLESGIEWYWRSVPSHPSPGLSERAFTRLSGDTAPDLAFDFEEVDDDGYRRYFVAFGFSGPIASIESETKLAQHVVHFVNAEDCPLAAVLVQVGDSPSELFFVPSQPAEAVGRLLSMWTTHERLEQIPYDRLHAASLESQFGLTRVAARP